MKKYLEQRVEQLELEVTLLKAKLKLNETKDTFNWLDKDYMEKYSKYDPFKDHLYNHTDNLDSGFPPYPDIWGSFEEKNPLDVISEDESLERYEKYIYRPYTVKEDEKDVLYKQYRTFDKS